MSNQPPLEGIRVLDLTRLLPGGYLTLVLADLGAEVIKVEEPGRGDYIRYLPPIVDGQSIYFHLLNRNKKSVSLNLKAARGVELLKELVKKSDVLVEGFRPGVMKRLGVDYDTLAAVNPSIVFCSLSGYGQSGPLSLHPGHDLNYQARAGIVSMMRKHGTVPILPPVQIADLAGAMAGAVGILAALLSRASSGRGRYIDVSLHESAMHWTIFAQCEAQSDGVSPQQGDSILSGRFAFYGIYTTADEKLLTVALPEFTFWTNFCEAIGRPDFVDRFVEEPSDALRGEIAAILKTKSIEEWMAVFKGNDICCDPVLDLNELRADPHIVHREVFRRLPAGAATLWCQLFPARMPDWRAEPAHSPELGQHTGEILESIAGLTAAELEALRAGDVI